MYVMWENVLGCTDIIKQPDGQDHCGLAEMIHGLHMLGYQYQVFVDDAARYGVPQTRARVILVGAKPNVHLPKHPVATHRTTTLRRKSVAYYNAALEGCYTKPSGSADQDAVTVGEALGDLPRDQAWRDAGPPKSSEPNQPPLGPTYIGEPVHHPGYRCEPQNDFQRAMRRGVGGSRPVLYDHWGVRITDALIAQLQHKGKLAKYTCRDSELSRTVVGKVWGAAMGRG